MLGYYLSSYDTNNNNNNKCVKCDEGCLRCSG